MGNHKAAQTLLVEFGMGSSLRRGDYTQAAERAVRDALWHNSINLAELFGFDKTDMRIRLDVGVQNPGEEPDKVDVDALVAKLPRGRAKVRAVLGGLNVASGEETIVVAQASVEAFLPAQTGWVLRA